MSQLLELVLTFAQIGILSFGGGYAAIPLVEKQVVEIKQWMTYSEFANILAIDELTPGPIAINAATFVGNKIAGLPGAIAATLGTILPSCIIAYVLGKIYFKYKSLKTVNGAINGLKSMVVAMILSTTLLIMFNTFFNKSSISIQSIDFVSIILATTGFIVLRKTKTNPLLIIVGCGLLGLFIFPLL